MNLALSLIIELFFLGTFTAALSDGELYGKFTGCVSCFGCKLPDHLGKCICKDGLAPVLEAIRNADGLIIGSSNYLCDMTAGFQALYERLIFQSLTYKTEVRSYHEKQIPVLMIMTSNPSEDFYSQRIRKSF